MARMDSEYGKSVRTASWETCCRKRALFRLHRLFLVLLLVIGPQLEWSPGGNDEADAWREAALAQGWPSILSLITFRNPCICSAALRTARSDSSEDFQFSTALAVATTRQRPSLTRL